jgi:hypothetical protein
VTYTRYGPCLTIARLTETDVVLNEDCGRARVVAEAPHHMRLDLEQIERLLAEQPSDETLHPLSRIGGFEDMQGESAGQPSHADPTAPPPPFDAARPCAVDDMEVDSQRV